MQIMSYIGFAVTLALFGLCAMRADDSGNDHPEVYFLATLALGALLVWAIYR
jgi:hypothetical protein